MATTCPYCNIEVRESAIEAEDGCCPECGAQISVVSSLLDDPDMEYSEYEDEDDVFSGLDDDEDDGNDFSRRDYDDDDLDDFDDDLDGDYEGFDEDFDEDFNDEDLDFDKDKQD